MISSTPRERVHQPVVEKTLGAKTRTEEMDDRGIVSMLEIHPEDHLCFSTGVPLKVESRISRTPGVTSDLRCRRVQSFHCLEFPIFQEPFNTPPTWTCERDVQPLLAGAWLRGVASQARMGADRKCIATCLQNGLVRESLQARFARYRHR